MVTLDDPRPTAAAVAIQGERIVAVGSDADIAPWIGPSTEVIDCRSRLVVPGFIEGHGHFLSLGDSKLKLDLSTAGSWDEIVSRVAAAAKTTPRGKWIVGRGWHQGRWKTPPRDNIEGYPETRELSRLVPDHPVLLTHGTGHMCLANERAMELAGITKDTQPPLGGEILRDAEGRPIGAFRESAGNPLHRALARAERERSTEEILRGTTGLRAEASRECLRFGVTTFQDAGSSFSDVDLFRELAEKEELPVRLWVMLNEPNDVLKDNLVKYRIVGFGNGHLTVRGSNGW